MQQKPFGTSLRMRIFSSQANPTQKHLPMKHRPARTKSLLVLITQRVRGVLIVCLALSGMVRPAQPATPPILKESASTMAGHRVSNFTLTDLEGRKVALSDFSDKKVIVLFVMGNDCPVANLYLKELRNLQGAYDKKGLQIIGIESNAGVTREQLAEQARDFKVSFPVLHDPDQRVAEMLRVTRTAETLLLDEQRVVRYQGRIDDRFGYTHKRNQPRRRDLQEALDQVLAGELVTIPETEPVGCLITRARQGVGHPQVTYARDVSRIIQQRCHECHRPGMIGPFSLLSYDDVLKHTDMIKEVVTQRRMPPWHADPRYGHFSNSRRMPQEEVDKLVAWIDAGTPFGDKNDLPPPKQYAPGWVIGEPDQVFDLGEDVTIQADGVVPYRYYKVPTHFEKDMWVQAAECRPGNRAVVHHIIVFARGEKSERREKREDHDGFGRIGEHISGTAPGDPPLMLPPGVAVKIPAGSDLVFQVHYTPTGKVETDRSQIGFILYKGEMPPKRIAHTRPILNVAFQIPAGEANHEVKSSFTFPRDVTLLGLMPHMHLRGKDFLYRATYPDGKSEILLSVPSYDFNWQGSYRFTEPLKAPAGTKIDCLAHFDNSADNRANPDPTKTVRWGDQTWEEMMIGWVTYIVPNSGATESEPVKEARLTQP